MNKDFFLYITTFNIQLFYLFYEILITFLKFITKIQLYCNNLSQKKIIKGIHILLKDLIIHVSYLMSIDKYKIFI